MSAPYRRLPIVAPHTGRAIDVGYATGLDAQQTPRVVVMDRTAAHYPSICPSQ
jgi:hypothetical protein